MTKQEIKKAGPLELAFRMDSLMTNAEDKDGDGVVDMTELEEIICIDGELKRRLKGVLFFKATELVDLIHRGISPVICSPQENQ